MDMDDARGMKSSFQLVPDKRYPLSQATVDRLRNRGFEVNIHDLNHDGRLFTNRSEFLRRVERINRYAVEYGASGFRSAVLYRNQDWFHALAFAYDMSVPNVAHLDPQRGGCCTVFPFFIGNLLELPLTTTQDYPLFCILKDFSISLWKHQLDIILSRHGLASFLVHPDYLLLERARDTYNSLLTYLAGLRADGKLWIALPGQLADWWRARSQMTLRRDGQFLRLEGPGSQHARIAHARLVGDEIEYVLGETP